MAKRSPNRTWLSVAGIFLFRAAMAFAQETAPEPEAMAEAERVIVTGSHIPSAEEAGPNPVLTINRELIEKSGERTAEELIKNLPMANLDAVPISNNATGFTPGASSISLRGFDTSATLVLIDGRRVAPYPVGNDGTLSFIDLNSIPNAAIDSIEILKDGASPTYGADAVAGVVNIKFRHNYRGAEATAEYGNTLDKDSGENAVSVLFGVGDDKTQVSGVLSYYRRNSIANRDRGFSARPPFLTPNSSPLNLELSRDAVIAAIQADTTITPAQQAALLAGLPTRGDGMGGGTLLNGHAPFGTNGNAPVSQYVFGPLFSPNFEEPTKSLFNYNKFSLTFPATERYGGFFNAEHKICNDQLVLYTDLLYNDVKVRNELAATATGPFLSPGATTLFIPPRQPVDAIDPATGQPFGLLGGLTPVELGATRDAFNPFNPFQQFISGFSTGRLQEFGNRIILTETDAFMTTLGLKGDKLFNGSWGYDAGFRYSQIKNTQTGTFVSGVLFNRILNANDPIFDPNSDEFIGTTVPYNPFTDYRVPFPSNQATVDFATVHPKDIDTSKMATFDLNIYTVTLFNLPAGGVGLAFGAQFRRENISQDVDQLENGDLIGTSQTSSTRSGRKSYGVYLETDVPIFSSANSIPGFHALEFTAAGRFEYYFNNDTNILVPKVGLRWQPFDDSFTIRSTWGEGFREPSLFQLFGSSSSGFAIPPDFVTPVTSNSNPNLEPEDSRDFTAGIVYTTKFIPGLTLSLDLYDIERNGVVILPGAEEVVARDDQGQLLPGEMVLRDATGRVLHVTYTYQNGDAQLSRGVDIGLQYQWQTPWGTFTSLTQATYLDSLKGGIGTSAFEQSNSAPLFSGSEDAALKWKGISRLDWAWKGLDIVATARYTAGFHEVLFRTADFGIPLPDGKKEHWVDATWIFDVQATYDFVFTAPVESQPIAGYSKGSQEMTRGKDGKPVEPTQTANYSMPCWKSLLNNTSITIGCNNVLGQDPPKAFGFFFGNSTGYPGSIYDATGRFVYVSLTKKF